MVPCLFALIVALTLTSLSVTAFAEDPHGATTAPSVSPQEAMDRLNAGNKRFVEQKLADKDLAGRRAATASDQHPYAIILACADSRVAPEFVFDETIGGLFVIRIAGNVVDPDVLGSIEYAVDHLHVRLIVVLGHERCGAVSAAISGGAVHGNLEELIHKVDGGKDLPSDTTAALAAAVRHNILHQATEMLKDSEPIKKAVDDGQVQIESGVYSFVDGEVKWLTSK